jgi:maltose O-acetyltransferase
MDNVHDWLRRVRSGEPFSMPDDEFMAAIFAADEKVAAFNTSQFTSMDEMNVALSALFGKVGQGVVVRPPVAVDVGFNIEIGEGTFLNLNTTLLDTYPIKIGRNVAIAPNCAFYPVGHPMRAADRHILDADGKYVGHVTSGAPIIVEDDVWIGGNVVVTQGVTIGARSMIGAGSVVTKSIPPDVFAAGNPCRVIRQL